MPKIDLCIEPLFTDLNSAEKVKKIMSLGCKAIEFWFWDHEFDGANLIPTPKNIDEIALMVKDSDLYVNDIVVNAPDGSIGGSLTNINDKDQYLARLEKSIEVAKKLQCKKMITCTGNIQKGISLEAQTESVMIILSEAARIAANEGITLVLEALNSTIDHPGYFLTSTKLGFDIVKKVNSPGLKLLYDIYHMQIMEGNLVNTIKDNIDQIGHFHSAGLPGRNELYLGEINYKYILDAIDQTGYNGYFGLEYWPVGNSEKSVKETMKFLGKV